MLLTEDQIAQLLARPADALDELDRLDCEESLYAFTRRMWSILEPANPMVEGWPMEAICEHLEAVTDGHIQKLLINVPPGFSKPVWVDEPVLTRRGRVRLGDVVVGDQVLTHRGRFRPVTAVHQQGVLPTLDVKTFGGRTVRAALDHPFLTTRGWVQAQDLQVGDVLGAVVPQEELGADEITPEEARLMGYLVGDGGVTHSPIFTNQDEEILADFERCAATMGWATTRRSKGPSQAALKATHVGIRGALPWLEKHGLKGGSSYTKRIPPAVLRSSNEIVANFLGAYWSCDGTVKVRHQRKRGDLHLASATTVNRVLAYDIQHALLRLGINARVRRHVAKLESKKQPGGRYVSYNILSSSHDEAVKFFGLPALVTRKREPLGALTPQRFVQGPLLEDEVVAVEASGEHECRCLTVEEDASFTAGDLAVHNSLLTNVFWPAYEWGPRNMPHLRHLSFSYTSILTQRDNRRFRDVLLSHDFGRLFGERFSLTKAGEQLVSNDRTGWKLATSIGGVGTGERGDRVALDDPNNVKDSESDPVREETNRWVREGMSNRLNDPSRSSIVCIQQRTHDLDVSGLILSEMSHDFEHLLIPMEWEGQRRISTVPDMKWSEDPRTEVGELAWPARYTPQAWKNLKITVGPYAVAGQYQQRPTPRGGGIFREEWWQDWQGIIDSDGVRRFPKFEFVLASLDGAFGQRQENDYSALTVWGVFRDAGGATENATRTNRHYVEQVLDQSGRGKTVSPRLFTRAPKIMLAHAWRRRLPLNGPTIDRLEDETDAAYRRRTMEHWGIVQLAADTCRRFGVNLLLIEAKANGIDIANEMRRQYQGERWGVQLIDPGHLDKVARAYSVQHIFADQMVYAPLDLEWADMVVQEMKNFPKSAHDDLTDTATQAMKFLRDIGLAIHGHEIERDLADAMAHQPVEQKPLYPA